ncbi:hypothetical protein CRE_26835 [Caenorhabditis remanei]|uniref:Uncharacterized protein n=1 Tax=Caenorhabditis remanei TaxID=31234 RepID=E3NKK8_CAERE|nr:hypothetical protein CRE_26835 [Caenorhabditis remanei]
MMQNNDNKLPADRIYSVEELLFGPDPWEEGQDKHVVPPVDEALAAVLLGALDRDKDDVQVEKPSVPAPTNRIVDKQGNEITLQRVQQLLEDGNTCEFEELIAAVKEKAGPDDLPAQILAMCCEKLIIMYEEIHEVFAEKEATMEADLADLLDLTSTLTLRQEHLKEAQANHHLVKISGPSKLPAHAKRGCLICQQEHSATSCTSFPSVSSV